MPTPLLMPALSPTMEVEAVDEGRIGKILVDEGIEGVKVNMLIACCLLKAQQIWPCSFGGKLDTLPELKRHQ